MAKQEPIIELMYVGLHPGGEEIPADEFEDGEIGSVERETDGTGAEEDEQTTDWIETEWTEKKTRRSPKQDAEEKKPIDLTSNWVDTPGVDPHVLFQSWRFQTHGLPKIEVPRSLTAKQFLEIQEMGAAAR